MSGAAPGDVGLVERYLEHVRVEKRLAQRTVELYALDLQRLQRHAAGGLHAGLCQLARYLARERLSAGDAGRDAHGRRVGHSDNG